MEAHLARVVARMTILTICLYLLSVSNSSADAAGYKTRNFTVSAPTPQLAKEIGDAAEMWRRQLSMEWLGKEMPAWAKPCPINARVAPGMGAGGATSFVFDRGEVFGWKMNIQGTRERILDSVLPHEVTHTIFASYFRQPLPRWADEGACTTVEHRSEIAKQERNLIQFLKTGRGIPFSQMFAMKEYPSDVMPLYAQGHSTAQWLIEARGRKTFLSFLSDGMRDENWPRAVRQHYGFENLLAMQTAWNDWVKQGRPKLSPDSSAIGALASNTRTPTNPSAAATPAVYRGQSPDDVTPNRGHELTNAKGPLTMASASGSVYARAAARAERERQMASRKEDSMASVYDATRQTGVIRR